MSSNTSETTAAERARRRRNNRRALIALGAFATMLLTAAAFAVSGGVNLMTAEPANQGPMALAPVEPIDPMTPAQPPSSTLAEPDCTIPVISDQGFNLAYDHIKGVGFEHGGDEWLKQTTPESSPADGALAWYVHQGYEVDTKTATFSFQSPDGTSHTGCLTVRPAPVIDGADGLKEVTVPAIDGQLLKVWFTAH